MLKFQTIIERKEKVEAKTSTHLFDLSEKAETVARKKDKESEKGKTKRVCEKELEKGRERGEPGEGEIEKCEGDRKGE